MCTTLVTCNHPHGPSKALEMSGDMKGGISEGVLSRCMAMGTIEEDESVYYTSHLPRPPWTEQSIGNVRLH